MAERGVLHSTCTTLNDWNAVAEAHETVCVSCVRAVRQHGSTPPRCSSGWFRCAAALTGCHSYFFSLTCRTTHQGVFPPMRCVPRHRRSFLRLRCPAPAVAAPARSPCAHRPAVPQRCGGLTARCPPCLRRSGRASAPKSSPHTIRRTFDRRAGLPAMARRGVPRLRLLFLSVLPCVRQHPSRQR